MTNVAWLAAHSTQPLERERLDRWAEGVEHTLPARLGALERAMLAGRHLVLVGWSDPAAIPRTWRQLEQRPAALAVSDGYPLGFEHLGIATPSPLAIAAALDADYGLVDRLLPPYANASLRDGRLTVATDALGFAKVYRAASGGLMAWSNSSLLASLFVFGRAAASESGWIGLLAREAFIGDASPLDGVTLEAPRTIVRAQDRADRPAVVRTDPAAAFRTPPPADLAAAVTAAIAAVYRSSRVLDVGRVTIPLSGGRDSRVLAAIALDEGTVDEFWTSSPPELDMTIAAGLLGRLDRPIPWSTRDKTADTRRRDREAALAGLGTATIWERLIGHQQFTEGEGTVGPQTVPPKASVPLDGLTVWGIGAEAGRAFYYDAESLDRTRATVERFWAARRIPPSFVDPLLARELLRPQIDALRAWIGGLGVQGLAELDRYYLFQRVRRLQNRIGTTSGIRPYFALPYLVATMGRGPSERVHAGYHREVVERAYPPWSGIPFAHEVRPADGAVATALSYAQAFWDSPFVAQLAADVSDQIPAGGLIIRDQVLRSIRAGGPATAVVRMRAFGRVLDHVAYLRFLDGVRAAFPVDAQVAAGPVPVLVTPRRQRRRRSPVAAATIRLISFVELAHGRLETRRMRIARIARRLWARAVTRIPVFA